MYMQSFLDFLLLVKRLQIWYGTYVLWTYVLCICFTKSGNSPGKNLEI